MQRLLYKTKSGGSPQDKPRVYFTCHPDDFDRTFTKVCEDIFKTHDCAIYYTENMTELLPEETRELDLERMNMFVVPVTFKLMTTPNRANEFDLKFAKERNILILPIMFETGIDSIYSLPENFGNRQYLTPFGQDQTAISYEEKLKKYLESTLFDDKTFERIRKAFDAYIFLSYRKMDRVYANDLMKLIHSEPKFRDLAIWYDEFLTPGEAFEKEIGSALSLSKLFAMVVTPNLTKYTLDGKPNYVMTEEYPKAKDTVLNTETGEKLPILPVQVTDMGENEQKALTDEFPDIPRSVDGRKINELSNAMYENLKRIALNKNNNDPEHNYLIGLAYLKGIDIETNPERGLELITSAAEEELPEAMVMIARMYHYGDYVSLDYHEELKWRKRLYEYNRRELGEEHPDTLTSLGNLAVTYGNIGENKLEVELDKKIWVLRGKVLGVDHPDTLTSLSNLASTYSDIGDYEKSQDYKKIAYMLRCGKLGEEHPDTLTSLSNLAVGYAKLGDYKLAQKLSEKAYALRCKVLGPEHPDTLTSLSNLAIAYGKLGNHTYARELEEKAYALRCKVLGSEHPDTLTSLFNLPFLYINLKEYNLALKLSEQCYETNYKVFGKDHPKTWDSLYLMAVIYKLAPAVDEVLAFKVLAIIYANEALYESLGHPEKTAELRKLLSE